LTILESFAFKDAENFFFGICLFDYLKISANTEIFLDSTILSLRLFGDRLKMEFVGCELQLDYPVDWRMK